MIYYKSQEGGWYGDILQYPWAKKTPALNHNISWGAGRNGKVPLHRRRGKPSVQTTHGCGLRITQQSKNIDSPEMFVACGMRITWQSKNLSYHQTAHKCLWLADHLAKPKTIVPQHSTQMFVACGLRITQLSKIIQDHQTAHKCLWIVDYLEKQKPILPPDSLQCLWHHWLVDHSKVKTCRTTRQPTRVCGLRIT